MLTLPDSAKALYRSFQPVDGVRRLIDIHPDYGVPTMLSADNMDIALNDLELSLSHIVRRIVSMNKVTTNSNKYRLLKRWRLLQNEAPFLR